MQADSPPFEKMDDPQSWTGDSTCSGYELGAAYLYQELQRVSPMSPLAERVVLLGNAVKYIQANYVEKGIEVPTDKASKTVEAIFRWGWLGYSLWKLRSFRSPVYDFELRELAGADRRTEDGARRLRSHGFTFSAAAHFAGKGFSVDFIKAGLKPAPDFFISRNNDRFPCEATTKAPTGKIGPGHDVATYFSHVHAAITEKKPKFREAQYDHGVLLVDVSPIYHLVEGAHFQRAEIITMEDYDLCKRAGEEDLGFPPSRVDRVLSFDDSPFAQGVNEIRRLLDGTSIRSVMFWRRLIEVRGDRVVRREGSNILGTMRGRKFWRYFPSTSVLMFPALDEKLVGF
ncbi:MAG: hypothetical protein K8T20_12045 [Planctomycetes bacterium]|nr:hypothetical protein [Planctomycetota bacterium]